MIRPATLADIPALIALGREMHEESSYASLNYSDEKVRSGFEQAIFNPEEFFLYVAEKDSTIIGMYWGLVAEYFFGHDRAAYDFVLFVSKKHRGSMAAVRLLRAFEEWAFSKNAMEICPAISTEVNSDRTAEFHARLGYDVVGHQFKKRRKLCAVAEQL